MAGPIPALSLDALAFSETLLQHRSLQARARVMAQFFSAALQDAGVVVYVLGTADEQQVWLPKAVAGDVEVADPLIQRQPSIGPGLLDERKEALFLRATKLRRESYAHLNIRRSFSGLAYLALTHEGESIGALEIITFNLELDAHALQALQPLARVAAMGLSAAIAHEEEQSASLTSLSRMTQFYDLEKSFHSTLELDSLLPIIASKLRDMMSAQAVNVWMVESKESLLLFHQTGLDPTTSVGTVQRTGEGTAFAISESGEPLLIGSSVDERLITRNAGITDGSVASLLSAPLMDGEECVGVVEIVNRLDGRPFHEDDLFMLLTICETANRALHNAGLFQAERKAEVLQALVNVSGQITSTLNLDRVAQTLVNGPQSVIPFERSALALEINSRIQVRAVSGAKVVNHNDPAVASLRELLEWMSFSTEPLLITQQPDAAVSADREETRAKFQKYFDESGMRLFYGYPLTDDQGRVGTLSYESSDPSALQPVHFELIKILAAQATVALRNAQLYQEVPFISVIEPILQRKRRFMAMGKGRRAITLAVAAVASAFLVLFPLPLRISGNASVRPQHRALIQPEMDGVIKRVLVREGEAVRQGTILAEMDDWNLRRDLASAQSKYEIAVSSMDRALATNDTSEAGVQQAQVAFWSSEVTRASERLEQTKLRSPIDGIVVTPQIENFAGREFDAGTDLAEVIDASHVTVDIEVPEQDVNLLRAGQSAAVKLESFPTQTFRGSVQVVSPRGQSSDDGRVFFARVDIPNPGGLLRAGMRGRGKVAAGWHPAAYVIFRRAAMWVWSTGWSWFGF